MIIYHGVKDTVSGGLYRIGLALADLDEPTRISHRLPEWVFGSQTHYERVGDVATPCSRAG